MRVKGKNIAMISGFHEDQYSMEILKSLLLANNSVTIFCFNKSLGNFSEPLGQKIVLFAELPDMAGYMRGLEKRLEKFDLIISSGSSTLSSFQACRAASKMGIPFLVLSTQTLPTTSRGFSNLEAIQYDIFENSKILFTPTESARSRAIFDGMTEEKIRVIPLLNTNEKFIFSESHRAKLKTYLKVPKETPVIFAEFSAEKEKDLENIFLALRMLKVTKKYPASGLRLLIWNQNGVSSFLKNRAFELNLTDSVMFLEQDIQPFERDLFCMGDIFVSRPSSYDVDTNYTCIDEKVQLTGCATISLESPTTTYGDLAQKINAEIEALKSPENRLILSSQNFESNTKNNLLQREAFLKSISELAHSSIKQEHHLQENLAESESLIEKGELDQALVTLKKCFAFSPDSENLRKIYVLMGDVKRGKNEYEQACENYSKSIDIQESSRAYAGLGHISSFAQSFEEAIVFFKKAASLDPSCIESKFGMAVCLYKLSIFEEAILWLGRCLAEDPENKSYLGLFISCALKLRNTEEAIDYLEGVVNHPSSRSSVILHLATLYERKGDFTKSCQLMNEYSLKTG